MAPVIRVVSDDDAAKETFLRLCGSTPFTFVDAGGLAQGHRVERMALSGEGGVFATDTVGA
jgi:predicted dinucleotide-binding enzyme